MEPGFPDDEVQRIRALRGLNILDTSAEERFDRLTRMASCLFDTPISLITLIDSERQWFKSAFGIDLEQTPRAVSFCGHTILETEVMVINDTHEDRRFADNPFVTGKPHVRFYAGVPLQTIGGHNLGALCIIDTRPRSFSAADIAMLQDVARLAEKEFNRPDLQTLNADLLSTVNQLKQAQHREQMRSKSLELISRGYPLTEILASITDEIVQLSQDLIATIQTIDPVTGEHQNHGSRRELNEDSRDAVVEPILASDDGLLGRVIVHNPSSMDIGKHDLRMIKESALIASIAIERARTDRLIWQQANFDNLTGLPNRNLMFERLEQEISKARRYHKQVGVMFIDLDDFKMVNDSQGHLAGDQLLTSVAGRLKACLRDTDTVARHGGDEFTVILAELTNLQDIERVAQMMLAELSRKFELDSHSFQLSASIGIAFYPDHGEDVDSLISRADHAMYQAKNSGRNRFLISQG